MSATQTFHFGIYTLRPVSRSDQNLARQWTTLDPHHDYVDPEFWLEQNRNSDSYLLLDEEGPLYFARLIITAPDPDWRAVEMHIQFPPEPEGESEKKHQRVRIGCGLLKGMAWLEKMLQQIEVRELAFDSRSQALIRFSITRLGFLDKGGGHLVKSLQSAR